GVAPTGRLAAPGQRVGDQCRHVRANAEAPVNFVVHKEIGKAGGNWMSPGDNYDWHIHIMVVAKRGSHSALLVLRLGVGAAHDLLELGPCLIGNERVVQDYETNSLIK